MTERFKHITRKYGIRMLIVVLSMVFLCTYIDRKEGFHMDEILAFQLSNAEYNPWIVPTQPVGRLAKFMNEHIDGETVGETVSNICYIVKDTLTKRGGSILATYKADVYETPTWISKEMFQAYVQCDAKDDFNLLSVYFNVKDDNHPPVHFMLLHLMNSIFKGEINVWHGAVINLAAMAVTLWILGLVGDILFQNKKSSIVLMLLFGFSTAIVASTIWIRMYALLTLWVVWILYLHLRKYAKVNEDSFARIKPQSGKAKWIGSLGILSVTAISFWTQYFGLFFILPLAFVTVVLLWKEKRIQELWAYIRTMVTAAVVGICVYPFAVGDVLFSSRGTEALSQWKNGFTEYIDRFVAFGRILAENVAGGVFVFLMLVLIPLVILIVTMFGKKKKAEGCTGYALFGMCLIPAIVYFLLAAKMSPYFVDRYIMAIFPVTSLIIVWLWDRAISCLTGKKLVTALVAGTVVLVSVWQGMMWKDGHTYLYAGYKEQLEVAEEYSQYPLVCYYDGYGFYENVMEMERYEQSLLIKRGELEKIEDDRKIVTQQGYVALIKYPGEEAGKEQLVAVMNVFGGMTADLLYEGGAFGDAIYLVYP